MYLSRMIDAIRLTALIFMVACACPQLAVAQNELALEPYPAFVVEESGYARCGPSTEYYRTDPLRHGQEVEVYAETDDGWLGIRPPADSFSWIPAESVELQGSEDRAVVIEDATVAWIGTQLGRARKYRWQVQLAKGEPVTILGRSEREGAEGPEVWYQIVPPSGEYRWLHRDQVVFSSEELVASIRRRGMGQNAESDSLAGPTVARTRPADSRTELEPDYTADPGSPQSSRRHSPQPTEFAADTSPALEQAAPIDSVAADSQPPRREKRLVNEVPAQDRETIPTAMAQQEQSAGSKLLGAIAFLGRPRLLDIGAAPAAPRDQESAADANWVVAAGNSLATIAGVDQPQQATTPVTPFVDASSPGSSSLGSVIPASGQQPLAVSTSATSAPAAAIRAREVSPERLREIEIETRGANVDRLSLILSRLMAARATAPETQPVVRAARTLASSAADAVDRGRARLLAERAQQYVQVAYRRDGDVVIRSNEAPLIPGGSVMQASVQPVQPSPLPRPIDHAPTDVVSDTGYLVQVYSARANSPPFALTDNRGRTIAYVTPMPGVNLRTHLNSRVQVSGNRGFVTGLNTPHILATQAIRTAE